MNGSKGILLSLLTFLLTLLPARASDATKSENWPSWRGPRLDGTAHETGIPTRFSDTDNVRWKTKLPGSGYSTPVVWGDRLFVTWCVEAEERRMLPSVDSNDGKAHREMHV